MNPEDLRFGKLETEGRGVIQNGMSLPPRVCYQPEGTGKLVAPPSLLAQKMWMNGQGGARR